MFYLHVILGLIFGSFLNVLIYRMPKDISIIYPGSQCIKCQKSIKWYDNIPILSFLLLHGKSRCCSKRISVQYPIIELCSSLLWIWSYLFLNDIFSKFLFLIVSSLLLVFILTDWFHFIIPFELNLFMFFSIVGLKIFASNFNLNYFLFIMFVGIFFLLLVYVFSKIFEKDIMGFGDIILIVNISLWLNTLDLLIIIFFSCILSIINWFLIYVNNHKDEIKLPFGSSLSLVTIIYFIIIVTLDISI